VREAIILNPSFNWECPSCGEQHVTHEAKPHTPLHPCKRQAGLSVPYAPVAPGLEKLKKHSVRHVINEREDWIGDEMVQYHEGRPIMNLVTDRADGTNDIRVYAPTAQGAVR